MNNLSDSIHGAFVFLALHGLYWEINSLGKQSLEKRAHIASLLTCVCSFSLHRKLFNRDTYIEKNCQSFTCDERKKHFYYSIHVCRSSLLFFCIFGLRIVVRYVFFTLSRSKIDCYSRNNSFFVCSATILDCVKRNISTTLSKKSYKVGEVKKNTWKK